MKQKPHRSDSVESPGFIRGEEVNTPPPEETVTTGAAAKLCGMPVSTFRVLVSRTRAGTLAVPVPDPIGIDVAATGRPTVYRRGDIEQWHVRYREHADTRRPSRSVIVPDPSVNRSR